MVEARARIGESVVWHTQERRLYWVDIPLGILHRTDPVTAIDETWTLPEELGCIGLRAGGGLIAGMRHGFYFFDPATGSLEHLHDPEPNLPDNRMNDGACDREGRFWAGTMALNASGFEGAFYRFDRNLNCQKFREGIGITNGLAFSPDGRTMYCADTHRDRQIVWAYDYDGSDAMPTNERVFIDMKAMAGRPDGATVDSDGCYWIAAVDGWCVMRYTPDGRLDRKIDMPVQRPSKLAFGGARLDTIYVTSISIGLTPEIDQPLAGGLFAIDAGVSGLAESQFLG